MDRYFEVRMLVKDESLRIKDIVKQTGYDKGHVSRLRKASRIDKLIADAVAAEREACVQIVEEYRIPVGNSVAGELAREWTYYALKEIREDIRAREQK